MCSDTSGNKSKTRHKGLTSSFYWKGAGIKLPSHRYIFWRTFFLPYKMNELAMHLMRLGISSFLICFKGNLLWNHIVTYYSEWLCHQQKGFNIPLLESQPSLPTTLQLLSYSSCPFCRSSLWRVVRPALSASSTPPIHSEAIPFIYSESSLVSAWTALP